ncbi:MAG: T9SS type A sorting domain-containing protein [Saprospiraceae bacterium]|nr:T9SS type A sorting domain-containing protein [Saprospiraceae bacterium]
MRYLLSRIFLIVLMTKSISGFSLECIGLLNVSLPETGTVTLTSSAFLSGEPCTSCRYWLSPIPTFDCSDLGDSILIQITESNYITGASLSCQTLVVVQNKLPVNPCDGVPIACRSDINIYLNAEGYAQLRPEDVLVGPVPGITYRVEPSRFECYDAGQTFVARVYGTTGAGVENYCTFNVNVRDNRKNPGPCIRIIDVDENFYPAGDIDLPIPAGTDVSFLNTIQAFSSQNTNINFRYYLSSKPVLFNNEAALYKRNLVLKKGLNNLQVKGFFKLPVNLIPGKYFLIGSLSITNGKSEIAYQSLVREIIVMPVDQGMNNSQLQKPVSIIYPNPIVNQLNVNNYNLSFYKVCLYDKYGRLRRSINTEDQALISIDVDQLEQGLYFLCFYGKDGSSNQQSFIKGL